MKSVTIIHVGLAKRGYACSMLNISGDWNGEDV